MGKRLRIVIADDHPVVREGIRRCLKEWRDIAIVGEADDGDQAIERVRTERPDVLLLDLTMPHRGGLEALSQIRRAQPRTRVIILTVHNSVEYVRQAIAARVDGYLLKDTTPTEYVTAIKTVAAGKFFISPGVAQHANPDLPLTRAQKFGLTPREFQYVLLKIQGLRTPEIAAEMDCTASTVNTFRKRVYKKLGVHNGAMLAHVAVVNGLTS